MPWLKAYSIAPAANPVLVVPSAFLVIFVTCSWLMSRLAMRVSGTDTSAGRPGPIGLARAFVLAFVPIAIAYHLAHYLSMLLTVGQFFIPLASDPFGYRWDLWGTADYKVDLGIVSVRFVWYAAATAVVLGHIFAVYLAHVVSIRIFTSTRIATISQIPMVVLMVLYTMVSLWLLAQPIVA